MRLAACIALGLAPTLPPPPIEISQADEIHAAEYTLAWTAPVSCPSAEVIEKRITALRTNEPGGAGVVDIRAVVTDDGDVHRLALTTTFRAEAGESSETRELAARDCDELAEAVALVVSFALAPQIDAVRPEPAAEAAPEPPPTPTSEITPAPIAPRSDPAPRPRRAIRVRGVARLGGIFEGGIVSGVTGGPIAALGLAWPSWRLEIHGAYLGPRRDRRDGVGARYEAGIVGARGCRRMRAGPLEIPLCIGAEGGAVRATTIGLAPSRVRHGPWIGPLVGAAVAWRRRRAGIEPGVWVGADVVARGWGSAFTFGGDERFRQSVVSARLSAGLEIFFP